MGKRKAKSEEILRRLNEVYAGKLEPKEKPLLEEMKAKFQRALSEGWQHPGPVNGIRGIGRTTDGEYRVGLHTR